jgi:aarF domain-containing kinase
MPLLQDVAVKVQHLKVKKYSNIDLVTMDFLVHAIKFFFPTFEFMWLAELSKKNLPLELAFTHEGRNSEMVAMLLSHLPWLKVPEIEWEYSTDRVLTMEYCHGEKNDYVFELCRRTQQPSLTFHLVGGSTFGLWPL